ncbi:MAG: SUMF1/EgtB/PvdO family nonheme iron enzyme, partial [Verrucomicrobiae bacterium]|nr:SUMF1/EgtB/PvdO family nonheme iron enzyme [Verrucomicrobiae bacterium]
MAIPIILPLRLFASRQPQSPPEPTPEPLWKFLKDQAKSHHPQADLEALEDAAIAGWLLICFDGADEVPPAQQDYVRQCLQSFSRAYSGTRIVLTCRIIPWQKLGWKLSGFGVFPLAEFTEEQIRRFVTVWYIAHRKPRGRFTREEADERTASLIQAVLGRIELRRLAGNPMLLTVMALLHTHRGRLPDDRTRLYQDVVNHLLLRWDDTRKIGNEVFPGVTELLLQGGPKADENSLHRTLAQAAYEAHEACPADRRATGTADIPLDRLRALFCKLHSSESWDWAKEVIRTLQVRSGLLIPREEDVFCFPHRSFQEFMAALHLVKQPRWQRHAARLVEDTGYWREVIKWAAGRTTHLLDDPGATILLLRELCPSAEPSSSLEWRRLALAAEVLLEAQPAKLADFEDGPDTIRRIVGRLVRLLDQPVSDLTVKERALAAAALGRLGDPRTGVGVKARRVGQQSAERRPDFAWCGPDPQRPGEPFPAGPFLMGGDPRALSSSNQPFHCTRIERPFVISKYPITVEQYRLFVQANGYENDHFWTAEGRKWRDGQADTASWPEWMESAKEAYRRNTFPIHAPEDYGPAFETSNHPQAGVTWFEAAAFCRWINATFTAEELGLPKGWRVRLPTDAEWERAARWPNGLGERQIRPFPWGDMETAEELNRRCNWGGTSLDQTSAVGLFSPSGDSSAGMADLAG